MISEQLQQQIEQEAQHYANVQHSEKAKHLGHPQSQRWDDAVEDWEAGATSYAEKWQEAEQRVEELEKWKESAKAIIDPICKWSQGRVKLGASIPDELLRMVERHENALKEIKELIDKAE